VPLALAAASVAVFLQGGASQAQTVRVQPSLISLVAKATQLSNEVDSLGQQFDSLKIQIANARAQEAHARQAAREAQQAMAGSQRAVSQLAAMGYMDGGMDPTLQMLTSADPATFLNQASTVQELDNQAGQRLTSLQREQLAAQRAEVVAQEEIATVNALQKQINSKVAQIHAKLAVLNSSAMTQALAIFDQTGTYPSVVLPEATNAETTALRAAMTKIGDWYVWGAAGPSTFDCSGLVVWAYAQEGISLPHYTGSLWNSGLHVSRADLQPGDLVFFFADISHVGIYLGNGLMVDAPSTGQRVQVQPVFWDAYVGAVRIT
jgi:cell wall-associated NlpC family hydrolase